MKRFTLLLSLLLLCSITFAQSGKNLVSLYRVTDFTIRATSGKGDFEFEKADGYLCLYDKENGTIKMDNEAQNAWYLNKSSVKVQSKTDKDGDKYTVKTYKAIDEEGISCDVSLVEYQGLISDLFVAVYSDITMGFILKKL